MKWHKKKSMHNWPNEPMSQWIGEKEWISESMKQWFNEPMTQSQGWLWGRFRTTPSIAVLYVFLCEIELSLQSRVDNFPRSSPGPAETETRSLRWPQEPHDPKKRSVSRPRVSSPVSSHASELLHFPTAWRWEADISWWYGWHDGVNADHDNGPELGRFLTKLPLINEIKWETSDSRTNVKCQHVSKYVKRPNPTHKLNCAAMDNFDMFRPFPR